MSVYDDEQDERYQAAMVRWGKTLHPDCESVSVSSYSTKVCDTCDLGSGTFYNVTMYDANYRWVYSTEVEGVDALLRLVLGA